MPLDSVSPIPLCHLRVSVTDTGIGIPTHAQANIFEPFAQGDGSTTRKYGGTGGLAIVKQLAEMMQGAVAVESIPGRGSTFSFTARLQKSLESSSAAGVRRYDLDGLRVLIVDSNSTTRSILENQLKAWHMHYGAADRERRRWHFYNINRRVDAVRSRHFRFAIAGYGCAHARTRHQKPGGDHCPASCGALGDGVDRGCRSLQQAGIQAILTKPFRQSRLYDCLATRDGRLLEEQAALRRTASPPVEVRTLGHGRILLAEDNPVNQEVALGMLEALGCHADLASNGREVLEALEQKTYELILMDCQMPEMDGFEATKHIREMEARNKGQQGSALTVRCSNFAPRTSNFGQFSIFLYYRGDGACHHGRPRAVHHGWNG